ncbi:MAG TPA: DMT family transporter [Vicinamibacteria bacterium]|nr:DMT family transporter [Vicinamibacteria bacterium]
MTTPSSVPPGDLRRGALLMAISAVLFACMAAAVSACARELPNAPIVFFRHFIMLLYLLPWLWRNGRHALDTEDLPGHLVRGLAGVSAVACYFYAVARLRLADAVLLNQSMPLFIPLVERAWLRERIPPRLWGVLLLGFGGLLFILKPGTGLFEPAALVGLGSAVLAAVSQVGIRRLTRTEPVARIVFYFGLVASVVALPPAAFWWRSPAPPTWALLLVMGVFATVGQLTLTRAYVYAPAARVGPFLYAGPVFAGFLDWLFWRRLPDPLFVVGAVVVVAAAVLALRLQGVSRPREEGALPDREAARLDAAPAGRGPVNVRGDLRP